MDTFNAFENDPLEEPKKMLSSKKFYLFRKMVIKIEFTPQCI